MIEDAIANFKSVVLAADANYVLTTNNGIADEARSMGLNITSGVTLTATRDITIPTSTKSYLVKNNTTGGQSLRVKTAAGTGITIPNGKTTFVLCDGVNVIMALDWVNALAFGDAPTTRTNLGVAIGTNVEAWDADLDALAALGSTGIAVRSAANTWAQRSLAQPAAGITISNSDGVAGNPTLALSNDLSALEGLSSTGIAVRTGTDAWAQRTIQGTANRILVSNGSGAGGDPSLNLDPQVVMAAIEYVFDGGGAVLTTGIKGDVRIPFACTINSVTLLADQAGSIVIDIWKDTYANYPPTVADTITAAAKPTLSAASKSEDTTLTGWTTSIAAGDTLRFNVDSVTTCTRVVLILKVTKT